MSTAEELNRFNAQRIAQDHTTGSNKLDKSLEESIFSELQLSHSRGELMSWLEIEAKDAEIAKLRDALNEARWHVGDSSSIAGKLDAMEESGRYLRPGECLAVTYCAKCGAVTGQGIEKQEDK